MAGYLGGNVPTAEQLDEWITFFHANGFLVIHDVFRGSRNDSQVTRYITQVTYAKRLVGHKYYPFMNYQMPSHCYEGASSRLKQLLGFLPNGAYG